MKSGKHPEKALTALKVKAITKPGRYADGEGLYLVVHPSGAKRWILRTVVQGKRRDIGLGGLRTVSLAEARERALEKRKAARSGRDPIAEAKAARRVVPTFEQAITLVHAEQKPSWKNPKHADQWINTLTEYAVPIIGSMPIDVIDTGDILKVLSPIWLKKQETARRVRQRLNTVFNWAKASGHRSRENPVGGVSSGLPKQTARVRHHSALSYVEIPVFINWLDKTKAGLSTKAALKTLILTATRTSEVLNAEKSEFDFGAALWTIPAERMKAKKEFRIPLGQKTIEILKAAEANSGSSKYLFPGTKPGRPLSNMTFLNLIREYEPGITGHGFRSSFRDWAAEKTSFPREVCEMALAHTIKDKTEAAYRRSDYLEKRRDLLSAWEQHVFSAARSNASP